MQVANHPQVGICWNSNPQDVESGSVCSNFQLLKPWLWNVHINELWKADYPWKELFRLFKEAGYQRYTLAEIPETADPVRLMNYYRDSGKNRPEDVELTAEVVLLNVSVGVAPVGW